jgi:predicted esterase
MPAFEPGKEVRVDDPANLGAEGYYLVYLPTEYKPDRTWPVIFCYHPIGLKPQVSPFKEVLGGKGFIIIGMPFYGGSTSKAYSFIPKDIETVQRLVVELSPKLKFDGRQLFIGGFATGGYVASAIGEASSSLWAGMAIFATGRYGSSRPAEAVGFRGKPIYLGVGETDSYLRTTTTASTFYTGVGAIVTMDTWPGAGHAVNTTSKVLIDWLWANGPLKQVKADLAAAKLVQASGRLGDAHAAYLKIASIPGDYPPVVEAAKAAAEIARTADEQLAGAEKAIAAKQFQDAQTTLEYVAATYRGSPLGEKAQKRLDSIRADPAIGGAIDLARQISSAKLLDEQAQSAEAAKDFASAAKCLELIVKTCPKSPLYESARKRLDVLRADPAVQKALREREAERDCKPWLTMADNFLKADVKDKARDYLQRIIDKYPDTEWAAQAQARLNALH